MIVSWHVVSPEVGGVLYVEHELLPDAFPANRIKILAMLSAQIAISIENSAMYAEVGIKPDRGLVIKCGEQEAGLSRVT